MKNDDTTAGRLEPPSPPPPPASRSPRARRQEEAHGTQQARRRKSADIPVLVDDVKRLEDGEFEMTRCTFFLIEVTGVVHDWLADLRDRGVPVLLFGVSAVLHQPSARRTRFADPQSIEALFSTVEAIEGLVVETSHIWLPNFLVATCLGDALISDPARARGEVIRVTLPLFQQALRFVQDAIEADRFIEICRDLAAGGRVVEWSKAESDVFREWSRIQIGAAHENYLKQREDGRGVLRWRDDRGLVHEG